MSSQVQNIQVPVDSYSINLEFFSGPMDLLLHLVQQQEVAVEKVSMKLIAEQYLQVVSKTKFIDIEKASEYLVIAATLMSIKSASLLPANNTDTEENSLEPHDERFYNELRERLRIYQLTKQRAEALIRLPQLGVDVFTRNDRQALQPTGEMLAEPEEVGSLAYFFAKLIKRVGSLAKTYAIRLEEVSVVSYMMKIIDGLLESKKGEKKISSFSGIMKNISGLRIRKFSLNPNNNKANSSNIQYKGALIGSFAAILELVKRGVVKVKQFSDYEDISIELCISQEGLKEVDLLNSEFDQDVTANDNKIVEINNYRKKQDDIEEQIDVPLLKEVNKR